MPQFQCRREPGRSLLHQDKPMLLRNREQGAESGAKPVPSVGFVEIRAKTSEGEHATRNLSPQTVLAIASQIWVLFKP
jgi:hypothetical protein